MAPELEYNRVKKMLISAILFSLMVLSVAVFITPQPSDAGGGCADQSKSFPISGSGTSMAPCGSAYNTKADAMAKCSSALSASISAAQKACRTFCKPFSTTFPNPEVLCSGTSKLPKGTPKSCTSGDCNTALGYDDFVGNTCGHVCAVKGSLSVKCQCKPVIKLPPPPYSKKEDNHQKQSSPLDI